MIDVDGYLRRLHMPDPGPPSTSALFALHRAHVQHVAYESLQIQLGRATSVDPRESAARVIAGRGGYCFHLNGAFAALLTALGYDVTWHIGVVFADADGIPGAQTNHLALTVELDGESWFVDAGLGDALYEPIALTPGSVRQGPFTYAMQPSPLAPDGWRFIHDPLAGSFVGMEFRPEPAGPADFIHPHRHLSTSPESKFVQVAQVGRRSADRVEFIRGCVLRIVDGSGTSTHVLSSHDEWFDAVRDIFGLPLHDVDAGERERLWMWLWAGHRQRMEESGAP